jgi:hypothetical protein
MYSLSRPIESIAEAINRACLIDLPNIEYQYRKPKSEKTETRERRPEKQECRVYHFPQVWSSTALGFGGIGGAAITEAYTTVVILQSEEAACVYFDGKLAYKVNDFNETFMEHLKKQRMNDCLHQDEYH